MESKVIALLLIVIGIIISGCASYDKSIDKTEEGAFPLSKILPLYEEVEMTNGIYPTERNSSNDNYTVYRGYIKKVEFELLKPNLGQTSVWKIEFQDGETLRVNDLDKKEFSENRVNRIVLKKDLRSKETTKDIYEITVKR